MPGKTLFSAVLVGNSMGGPVALETTRLLPDKVVGIVAVDTFQVFLMPPPNYVKQQAQAFRSDFDGTMRQMVRSLFHTDVDPALYAQVEKKMLKGSTQMAAALMESFTTYDLVEAVKKVPHPIRCINGDLFPTQVEKNRLLHPDFNAVILPHTDHYPMLERPELFNRHLEEILSRITGRKKEEKICYENNTVDAILKETENHDMLVIGATRRPILAQIGKESIPEIVSRKCSTPLIMAHSTTGFQSWIKRLI